jgi:hypothetical protein
MRPITNAIATLVVVSLAPLAYTRVPARDGAQPGVPMKGYDASSVAVQEPRPEEPKAPRETPQAKPPRTERQQTAPKQQEKPGKEQQKTDKKQSKEEQKEQKQPAGRGSRIPDRDFKAHFGQEHRFKAQQVITTTRIVPNQTRFVFSGFTFVFVDPWPEGWLLTDDCYIDFLDGEYFLLDPFHPGIRVALFVAG